jgi:hypothetical protein
MTDGVGYGKVNYGEPAIPVIAPVPLASLKDLLETAAQEWARRVGCRDDHGA